MDEGIRGYGLMLFNAYEFIFLFLPLALLGYFLLRHREQPLAAIGEDTPDR